MFGAQVVSIGVERGSFHIALVRPTTRATEAEGPAVLHHAGGPRHHHPVAIGPVGRCIGDADALADAARADIDVRGPTDTTEVVPCCTDTCAHLHPARHIIQARPARPLCPTSLQVVHQYAIDGDQGVLRIVSTDAEACRTEIEARHSSEHITRRLEDPGYVLRAELRVQVIGGYGEDRKLGTTSHAGVRYRRCDRGVRLAMEAEADDTCKCNSE